MASNAIIGALRVVLGADTAALETGLKNAQSKLATFGAGLEKSMKMAAGATVVALGAIGIAVKSTIDEADKLGKMAQSVGIPVEELSRLKHAADLSDVSVEELGKSVGKLSKAMVEVAGGGAGPAKQAFEALGISVKNTDGTLKSSSEVLSLVAERFKGYEDGAAKTALAMAIFGKAGASMIPLLNAGAAGLKEMKDEADELGIVVDTKTAKSAEAFNDNLTRMGKIKDGIILQVTARMLPAFQNLSQMMLDASKNSDLMAAAANGITSFLKGTVETALTAGLIFQRLGAELSALWRVAAAPDFSSMKAAWAEFGKAGEETKTKFGALKETIGKFWTESGAVAEKTASDFGPKVAAPIIMAAEKGQNALEAFLSSQVKRTAAMTADAQTIGLSVGAHEKLRIALEAQAIATEKNIPITEALRLKIEATGLAMAAAAEKVKGAQLTQEALLPWQTFNMTLDQNRQLLDNGAISLQTYQRLNQMTAEKAGADWGTAGASIAGSFATISGAFGKEGSKMAKAAQVFGAVQATISMFTGAAKALELPWPANLAAMASVLAKGASFVASIKSQKVPGFKMGGAFKVPGGVGGGDKVPVSFMAEPGEDVTITPNGSGARGAGSAAPIIIQMPAKAILDREWLRGMIDQVNDMTRDGYRLQLATA